MKPYKTEFIDNDGRRVTGAFLPIEGDNVGGLEPWMVEFLSKPSSDPVLMPEHLVYVENGQWYFHIDETFSQIAAAIDAILKEAEE